MCANPKLLPLMPAKKAASTEPTPPANKTAAKKSPAKKAAAKKAPAPAMRAAVPPAEPIPSAATATRQAAALRPSRDQIAHAAYLNFLKRKERGLPGDPAGDWLDAERQLLGQA